MDVAKDTTPEIMLSFFHKKIIEFPAQNRENFRIQKEVPMNNQNRNFSQNQRPVFFEIPFKAFALFCRKKNTQRNKQRCHCKSATEKVIAHCLQQWNVKAKLKTSIFFANRDLISRHFAWSQIDKSGIEMSRNVDALFTNRKHYSNYSGPSLQRPCRVGPLYLQYLCRNTAQTPWNFSHVQTARLVSHPRQRHTRFLLRRLSPGWRARVLVRAHVMQVGRHHLPIAGVPRAVGGS